MNAIMDNIEILELIYIWINNIHFRDQQVEGMEEELREMKESLEEEGDCWDSFLFI